MTNNLEKDTNDNKKKNATMREWNDNIDHKNMVIIWMSLCLQMK